MIRKTERGLTPGEIEDLTRSVTPSRRSRVEHAFGAVFAGVPGLACLGLVLALYLNRAGLPPHSLWALAIFGGLLAIIGLWLTQLAAWHVFRFFIRTGPAAPRMSRQRAEAVRANEVVVHVDAVWALETGDDDVPSLLVRSGDSYVCLYGSLLDDLWPVDDGAWRTLRAELTCVLVEGELLTVALAGPPLQIGSADVVDQAPRRGTAWWFRGYHELTDADLTPSLRAQLASRH